MNLVKVGAALGAIFTICAVVFALTVYAVMYHIEENIAYMALYYDDMATSSNNSAFMLWSSSQAWRWCEMYRVEQRTLDWKRYSAFCEDIQKRTGYIVLCEKEECHAIFYQQNETIQKPIREKWLKSPPYLKFVFRDDYRPNTKIGTETVGPFK